MSNGEITGKHHHSGPARLRAARQQFWESDRSLSALLVFLVFSIFIIDPLADVGMAGHLVIAIGFTLILMTGVLTVARTRTTSIAFGAVAVASLAVHWARYVTESPRLNSIDALGTLVACGMLAAIVLVQVFREGPITLHRIQGAIAVYLLLGLMWAAVFALVFLNDPTAFNFPSQVTPVPLTVLRARFMYFSFTTLTTVGYGDITAASPLARSLAMLEAVTGQLFPAILLARLVSMELYYRQSSFDRDQAALDRKALAREVIRQLREDGVLSPDAPPRA